MGMDKAYSPKMNDAVSTKLQALIIKAAIAGTPIPNGKGGRRRALSLTAVRDHEGTPKALHAHINLPEHRYNRLTNPATFQGDVLTFTCGTEK
jgi:hypothetical protein